MIKKDSGLKFAVVRKDEGMHGQVSKLKNLTIILAVIGAVFLITGIGLRLTGHVTTSGTSNVCIGTTAAVCSDFARDSGLCSNYGCSWNPGYCNEPPSCEFYDIENCTDHSGCFVNAYCSGDAFCSAYHGNESACIATGSCSWNSEESSCTGTFTCPQDEEQCNNLTGCYWSESCQGMRSVPCSAHRYDNCLNFGGCSQTTSCTGDVSCSNFDYDSFACTQSGCTWNDGSCTGSGDCSSVSDQGTCQQSGCNWGGFCSGGSDCSVFAGGDCDAVSGCNSGGYCSGTIDCSQWNNDDYDCTQVGQAHGCVWNSDDLTCSGSYDCSGEISQSECEYDVPYGCSWNPTCDGTVDCSVFDEGSCGSYPGCSWNGECSSSGSESCNNLDGYSCNNMAGCSWGGSCSSSGSELCSNLDMYQPYCEQGGCSLNYGCDGVPWLTPCSSYNYDGSMCSEAGCDWQPDTCSGDLTCGTIYDSYSCENVGGCSWLSAEGDYDNDGVSNEQDNCAEVDNPDQNDSDAEYIELNFTKENYENVEDCITDGVCITRDEDGAVYNNGNWNAYWACGRCGEETSQYYNWIGYLASIYNYNGDSCISGGMAYIVGVDTCLNIPAQNPGDVDEYWDIHWNSWQRGAGDGDPLGGGFSYTRSSLLTDNLGDACDECPLDRINDPDEDNVCGGVDNCPYTNNSDQNDSDNDGIGDACDNCPTAVNPNQNDSDDDGIGNVCDDDVDGDGNPNELDNCVNDYNPGQEDSDGGQYYSNTYVMDESSYGLVYGSTYGNKIDLADGKIYFLNNGGPIKGYNMEFSCGYCWDGDYSDAVSQIGGNVSLCAYLSGVPAYISQADRPLCAINTVTGQKYEMQIYSFKGNAGCYSAYDRCSSYGGYTTISLSWTQLGDGIGDACDNCRYSLNPSQLNSDGDLYGDACDNCAYVANAEYMEDPEWGGWYEVGQDDYDGDGVGDACDNCANEDCPQRQLEVPWVGESGGYCEYLTREQCESGSYYQINSYRESKSCYWGTGWNNGDPREGCWACGPSNEERSYCSNACEPVVNCGDNVFAGERACTGIYDQETCDNSYQITPNGGFRSCYWGSNYWGSYGCYGCGPTNEGYGYCQNECSDSSYNPSQENADNDSLGDVCDKCASDSLNDGDGDGICDSSDICVNDSINDPDMDNICARDDNCDYLSNPEQDDSDNDGIGDVCDNDIPYSSVAPNVVDGVFNADEWADANVESFYFTPESEHPPGYIYIYEKHDNDYVYFAADVTPDNTEESDDTFGSRFDIGNNDVWCERNIGGGDYDGEWTVYGDNTQNAGCNAEDFESSAGFGITPNVNYSHRFFEMAIPVESFGMDISGGLNYSFPVGKVFWGYGTLSPTWTYPADTDLYDPSEYMDMFLESSPDLQEIFRHSVEGQITDAEIDDIDYDGRKEIVFSDMDISRTIVAVDALTGDLKWENSGYSGSSIAVGDFFNEQFGNFKGVVILSHNYVTILNALDGSLVTQWYTNCYSNTDVEIADLNNDEYDDIAYSDDCSGGTVVAVNGNGLGELWRTYSPAREIAIGKLTDDDIDDVAFAGTSYSCGVIDGLNGQIITDDCYYSSDDFGYSYNLADSVAVADVNGDGYDDAVFGQYEYHYDYNYGSSYLYRVRALYSHQQTDSGFSNVDSVDLENEVEDVQAVSGRVAAITEGLESGESANTIYLFDKNMNEIVQKPHSNDYDSSTEINIVDIERCGEAVMFGAAAEDKSVYLYKSSGDNLGKASLEGRATLFKTFDIGNGECLAVAANLIASDGSGGGGGSQSISGEKGDGFAVARDDSVDEDGVLHVFKFKLSSVVEAPDNVYVEEQENSDGSTNVTVKNEETNNDVFVIELPVNETIDFTNVAVNITEGEIVKITGLNITKSIYFVNASSKLCILDSEDLASLTAGDSCEDAGEFELDCPGVAISPNGQTVTCTLDGTTATVGPLNHSGVTVFVVGAAAQTAVTQTGGGGTSGCISKWECGAWGSCVKGGTMTRTCVDSGSCRKPEKTEVSSCDYAPSSAEEEKPEGKGVLSSIAEGIFSGLKGALSFVMIALGIIVLIGAGISFKFWFEQRRRYRF